MKRPNICGAVVVLFTLAWQGSADLLIAWDSGVGTNYSYTASGITGNLYTGSSVGAKTDGNSMDETYGSVYSGAATNLNWAVAVGTNTVDVNNKLGIRIVNNTGSTVVLDSLHFDAGRTWAGSPQTLTVTYGYGSLTGVDSGAEIDAVTGLPQLLGAGNPGAVSSGYQDVDILLTGLAYYTLAPGEEATFQIYASNATGTAYTYIDNIAISGTVVPEPATLGMLGLGGLLAVILRRIG
ncbi:MAG: PEP-CTERM sorting domain-containing protein [Kiritimatiellales bacterium]